MSNASEGLSIGDIAFHAAIRAEQRESLAAGRLVAKAAHLGDVDMFQRAAGALHYTVDGWSAAMRTIGRLPSVSTEIQDAFRPIWVETKMLPLMVGHRPTVAAALRRLMAQNYQGGELTLYRGASASERRRRLYGFSWSTRPAVADEFARHWRKTTEGGVILKTVAPAAAILWQREEGESFDEGEVVVDPYRLGRIAVYHRHAGTKESLA